MLVPKESHHDKAYRTPSAIPEDRPVLASAPDKGAPSRSRNPRESDNDEVTTQEPEE
jgi:hypothetical protein